MGSRRWIFTLNNYLGLITEEDRLKLDARYIVFQEEVGASGTPHLQGYIEFNTPRRMAYIKNALEEEAIHLEPARGTANECKAYCTKEDTRVGGPYELGIMGGSQGKRNDLLALRDAIKSGASLKELIDNDAVATSAIRYLRASERLIETYPITI